MTREEILNKAKECVCGQREQDYGTPEDNFRLIGKQWADYINGAKGVDIELNGVDVAMMMIQFKTSRIATGTATMDSFIDIAGYAACGGELAGGAK